MEERIWCGARLLCFFTGRGEGGAPVTVCLPYQNISLLTVIALFSLFSLVTQLKQPLPKYPTAPDTVQKLYYFMEIKRFITVPTKSPNCVPFRAT